MFENIRTCRCVREAMKGAGGSMRGQKGPALPSRGEPSTKLKRSPSEPPERQLCHLYRSRVERKLYIVRQTRYFYPRGGIRGLKPPFPLVPLSAPSLLHLAVDVHPPRTYVGSTRMGGAACRKNRQVIPRFQIGTPGWFPSPPLSGELFPSHGTLSIPLLHP